MEKWSIWLTLIGALHITYQGGYSFSLIWPQRGRAADRVWFSEGFFLNRVLISSIFVLNRVSLHDLMYSLIYRTLTKSQIFTSLPVYIQEPLVQHIQIRNGLWLVHSSYKEGVMLGYLINKCLRQGTKKSEICLNRVSLQTQMYFRLSFLSAFAGYNSVAKSEIFVI